MAPEYAKKPQNNACAGQNRKANGDTADTYTDRVMAVNIEGLCRPEHDHREEVGTRNEGDNKRKDKGAGSLLEATGEHWVFGTLDFPDNKRNDEGGTDEERSQNMRGGPWVLHDRSA